MAIGTFLATSILRNGAQIEVLYMYWDNFIKPRLRSYVGIDYHYLDDFLESFLNIKLI